MNTSDSGKIDRKTVIFNALELVHGELHELAHEGGHAALIAEIREHLGHSYLADTNAPQGEPLAWRALTILFWLVVVLALELALHMGNIWGVM